MAHSRGIIWYYLADDVLFVALLSEADHTLSDLPDSLPSLSLIVLYLPISACYGSQASLMRTWLIIGFHIIAPTQTQVKPKNTGFS